TKQKWALSGQPNDISAGRRAGSHADRNPAPAWARPSTDAAPLDVLADARARLTELTGNRPR
ncbi:hypothetical protein, partial [Streptosporangium sp. NPDC003464]